MKIPAEFYVVTIEESGNTIMAGGKLLTLCAMASNYHLWPGLYYITDLPALADAIDWKFHYSLPLFNSSSILTIIYLLISALGLIVVEIHIFAQH